MGNGLEKENHLKKPFSRQQIIVAWMRIGGSGNGERRKYRREIVEFRGLDWM